MNDKIAVIVHPYGVFEVKVIDQYGGVRQLSYSHDLGLALAQAASALGHPLVLPLSGPTTMF